ncbi:MAG: transglycosylase SLT domain-containing protein [Promethearchaeota archaeon]|nr:MAG: transglycosylase SLT domain-containing protein [Candidatus Lokiarchaeota archaeon]
MILNSNYLKSNIRKKKALFLSIIVSISLLIIHITSFSLFCQEQDNNEVNHLNGENLCKSSIFYHPDPNEGGAITDWLTIGPFNYFNPDWDHPITTDKYHFNITDTYIEGDYALGGDAVGFLNESKQWAYVDFTKFSSYSDNHGYLDFNHRFGGSYCCEPEHVCGYASCYIRSPVDLNSAYLKVGSDDGIKIWRDGIKIHDNHILRHHYPDREVVDAGPLSFEAGKWYYFIVLVEENDMHWGFFFRFSNNSNLYDVNPENDPDAITNLDISIGEFFDVPHSNLILGDIVESSKNLNVRNITEWNNPLDPNNIIFTMQPPHSRSNPPYDTGRIIDGPIIDYLSEYLWWKIEWDNAEIGWSAEFALNFPNEKYFIKSEKEFKKIQDIEDPFNYNQQYELDNSELLDLEDDALSIIKIYANLYKISPALLMGLISHETGHSFDPNSEGDYIEGYNFDPMQNNYEPTAFGYMQVRWPAAYDLVSYNLVEKWWEEVTIYGDLIDRYNWFFENCSYWFGGVQPTDEKFFAYLHWANLGTDPETNIKFGTLYLKDKYDKILTNSFEDIYNDSMKSALSAYNAYSPKLINRKNYVLEGVIEGSRDYKFFLSIIKRDQPIPTAFVKGYNLIIIIGIISCIGVAVILRQKYKIAR